MQSASHLQSSPPEGVTATLPSHAAPELTVRAILTGMAIGALLTPCNVYSGLKIGWTFNMSVASGLLAYAFWTACEKTANTRPLGLLENNINQTSASSAASIISSGLAAPIPALALLTGQTLSWPVLATWLFVVSTLGIVVAAGLREQLLLRDRLPFPSGIVTAETMREIHDGGMEARARLRWLAASGTASAALKWAVTRFGLGPVAPAASTPVTVAATGQPLNISAMNLGLALDPSVLMIGFGAIVGLRIALSALLGAVLGWAILAPIAIAHGWVNAGPADSHVSWFGPLVEWLLWPGATLMVTAALTSFAFSVVRLIRQRRADSQADSAHQGGLLRRTMQNPGIAIGFAVTATMCIVAQRVFFDIGLVEALLATLLSGVLAIVAARVSGETGITPIGALGKITQLTFGAVSPGNVTANLMSANVTGGAAGQCADLMHDLKTGALLSATPRFQFIAQVFGVLTGSLVAAATYIALFPDPQSQLLTPEWPAPAVATWKAVAEVLSAGLHAMPDASGPAIAIAFVAGAGLATVESLASPRVTAYLPSASAMGLGFVIPAWNAISLFIGAAIAALITWRYPAWTKRRLLVVAAGLIVGESLAGVFAALASFAG